MQTGHLKVHQWIDSIEDLSFEYNEVQAIFQSIYDPMESDDDGNENVPSIENFNIENMHSIENNIIESIENGNDHNNNDSSLEVISLEKMLTQIEDEVKAWPDRMDVESCNLSKKK